MGVPFQCCMVHRAVHRRCGLHQVDHRSVGIGLVSRDCFSILVNTEITLVLTAIGFPFCHQVAVVLQASTVRTGALSRDSENIMFNANTIRCRPYAARRNWVSFHFSWTAQSSSTFQQTLLPLSHTHVHTSATAVLFA